VITAKRVARLALAAPALLSMGGASVCGVVMYDTSQRELILEPKEQISFALDSGSINVYALDRTAIVLSYYLTGSDTGIERVGRDIRETSIDAFILCEGDFCNADFSADVPLGTAISADTENGSVTLIGVDGDISSRVMGGDFTGIGLGSAALDLELDEGLVTIGWKSAPTDVRIGVTTGDVELTLPAGSYRCDLTTTDGELDSSAITCDDAADVTLSVLVQTGNITVKAATP
jgi:hypothetical protein